MKKHKKEIDIYNLEEKHSEINIKLNISVNIPCIVEDIENNTKKYYPSKSSVSKKLNIHHGVLDNYLNTGKIYKNKYKFYT